MATVQLFLLKFPTLLPLPDLRGCRDLPFAGILSTLEKVFSRSPLPHIPTHHDLPPRVCFSKCLLNELPKLLWQALHFFSRPNPLSIQAYCFSNTLLSLTDLPYLLLSSKEHKKYMFPFYITRNKIKWATTQTCLTLFSQAATMQVFFLPFAKYLLLPLKFTKSYLLFPWIH